MIKQAGILLTLCATSLVVINIRTLETVERSGRGIDDDDPYNDKDDYEVRRGTGYRPEVVIETCLVARWAGYPAAFSSSWGFFADLEMADGAARTFSRYNLSATFYLSFAGPAVEAVRGFTVVPERTTRALADHELGLGGAPNLPPLELAWKFRQGEEWLARNFPEHRACRSLAWDPRGFNGRPEKAVAAEVFESALDTERRGCVSWPVPEYEPDYLRDKRKRTPATIPAGSYRKSCKGCAMGTGGVLRCTACRTWAGSFGAQETSIDPRSCAHGEHVGNRGGDLTCEEHDTFDWYDLRATGTIEDAIKWWNEADRAWDTWDISFDTPPEGRVARGRVEGYAEDIAARVAREELWVAPVGSVVAYVRGAAELSVAHAFVGAESLAIRADGAPGVPWAVRLSCASEACRGFWERHAERFSCPWVGRRSCERERHAGRLVSDGATLLAEHGALLIRGLVAGRVYVFGPEEKYLIGPPFGARATDAVLAGITSRACEVEPAYYEIDD